MIIAEDAHTYLISILVTVANVSQSCLYAYQHTQYNRPINTEIMY